MVWLVLAAIVFFMSGLIVWGFTGTVDISVKGDAVVSDGEVRVMLADNERYWLDEGMIVLIENEEVPITCIEVNEFGDSVGISHITCTDGLYPASVIVRSASPFRLLFGE